MRDKEGEGKCVNNDIDSRTCLNTLFPIKNLLSTDNHPVAYEGTISKTTTAITGNNL